MKCETCRGTKEHYGTCPQCGSVGNILTTAAELIAISTARTDRTRSIRGAR